MQEIKKRRIVLASVLKPVDDTRMYEKIGVSLADRGNYEVYIIGYPSLQRYIESTSIHFLPLKPFQRLSLQRLLAPFKILKKTIQVQPELLIVNTHELLIVGILNRILFGTKIIYDIQENYWRNILLTNAFYKPLKPLLAAWVRLKEMSLLPFFHYAFLAEKGYERELKSILKKYIIIQNKVRVPKDLRRQSTPGKTNLLFSGTLAESTGVFESIALAKSLHALDSDIALTIIGYCAKNETYQKLVETIEGCSFIQLIGGNTLVPHHQILEAIMHADFGLIYYPLSPHIENAMPTKLYEYLGCQLPIILHAYSPWVELCNPYEASININFLEPLPAELLEKLKSTSFYKTTPQDVFWESEEKKLLDAIKNFLPSI